MKNSFLLTITLLITSIIFTIMVVNFDVAPSGIFGTDLGFSTLNLAVFDIIGTHLALAKIADILGYIALLIAIVYGVYSLVCVIKKRSLKIPSELYIFMAYLFITVLIYIIFTRVTLNYRPIIYEGSMEASFPSSHTILGITYPLGSILMVKYSFLKKKFSDKKSLRLAHNIFCITLTLGIVALRLFSGIHWCTDIIGGALYSATLLSALRMALLAVQPSAISARKSFKI